jgi:hypothetical protein
MKLRFPVMRSCCHAVRAVPGNHTVPPLIGFEVTTKLVQLYFKRLNTTRTPITNSSKTYNYQTRKSLLFDTYGKLK